MILIGYYSLRLCCRDFFFSQKIALEVIQVGIEYEIPNLYDLY